MEMASKSQKDKSKFCESCDKRFAYNKRLVEHLDKTSGCKEFYISKEITLPVTKAQTKGPSSKDLGEENVENHKDETIDNGTETDYPETLRDGDICVTLLDNKLWSDFHKLGTEMIITKAGR